MPTAQSIPITARQAAVLLLGIGIGVALTQVIDGQTTKRGNSNHNERELTTPVFIDSLSIQGSPFMGRADAPVTVVEFSDFECPYCRRFHEQVLIPLKREYIDKGLVRFVHKDLPLSFHSQADLAARIARCSQQDGQYWQAYRSLFDRQNCLSCEGPAAIVSPDSARQERLSRCAEAKTTRTLVNTDRSEAGLLGIRATPTFVIGPTLGEDLHRGRVLEGAMPWESFQKDIDRALDEAKQAAGPIIDAKEPNR